MAWWVYKCNSRHHPYDNDYSDWRQFFAGVLPPGGRWGLISVIPDLARLQLGDQILAYQTDRNELVGLARVVELRGDEVHLEGVETFGNSVRVRLLKTRNPALARVPAFAPGPKRTLNAISEADANRFIDAAHEVAL